MIRRAGFGHDLAPARRPPAAHFCIHEPRAVLGVASARGEAPPPALRSAEAAVRAPVPCRRRSGSNGRWRIWRWGCLVCVGIAGHGGGTVQFRPLRKPVAWARWRPNPSESSSARVCWSSPIEQTGMSRCLRNFAAIISTGSTTGTVAPADGRGSSTMALLSRAGHSLAAGRETRKERDGGRGRGVAGAMQRRESASSPLAVSRTCSPSGAGASFRARLAR